ncbi:MAG: agmatine deiminase [Rhodothermales bacterium]|jgi:agmatine deiminase
MPAEWEPHQGTWVSWPHNRDTWPGAFGAVEPAFKEIAVSIAASETLHINVLDGVHELHVRGILGGIRDVVFHHIPTNDAWCRDHGATFVRGTDGLEAVDFTYNAWGGKYPPFDLDAQVARRMAALTGAVVQDADLVLEGGAIEVNGRGVLLTTESCVLNPNRNPGLTRPKADSIFRRLLGVTDILWVGGHVEGDDTDGHIDNLARFVTPQDIVMSVPGSPDDRAHAGLEEAFADLEKLATPLGIRLHRLPLPAPLFFRPEGEEQVRLPASHANFYIANRAVLVPGFGGASDLKAQDLLAGFFPDRAVVLIDCRDLVWGLGAIHCLTQQVPAW